ncbi:MAG TPA: aminoglycoside phosphotransferase family protein [Gemmatimonadaceae bacterium]|nr:aminoglycoside phosphotransferase family protein [Gemmatimonadaceae bacterium]
MIKIPERLAASCAGNAERKVWLDRLPLSVADLAGRWEIELGDPFEGEDVSCAWVSVATRTDGTTAIFKVGMPHMEGDHEIAALRFLDGDPTVRILEWDEWSNAMLLERCIPGTTLREMFQPDQDVVIAGLLKRFWRTVDDPHRFRPLSDMTTHWIKESIKTKSMWYDSVLVNEGLFLLENLSASNVSTVLLATDLHAGNVLRAEREPWLAIDPKPFVGDRAFDATQHLLNCRSRLRLEPYPTMRRMADLCEVDYDRLRLWTFARLAAEPRSNWDDDSTYLAKLINN